MCEHGNYKDVEVIQQRNIQTVKVDSCIADEVAEMNRAGIVTVGSCCGHGESGIHPHVLIEENSVNIAESTGYHPTKYFHGPNDYRGIYEVRLR